MTGVVGSVVGQAAGVQGTTYKVQGSGAQGVAPVPPVVTDPNFDTVRALLHMDGADGATTTTDLLGHTTAIQSPNTLATASAKFGTAGAHYVSSNSGPLITVTNNGDFNFGAGDFTLEGWFYFPTASAGVGSRNTLFSLGTGAASDIVVYFDDFGASRFLHSEATNTSNATIGSITGSTPFPLDTWVHVALTRTSGTFNLFMAGVSQGTNSGSAAAIRATASNGIRIGRWTSGDPWRGEADEFRASAMSRYTAGFTPPTAAFPDSGPAVTTDPNYASVAALLHFDGTNGGTTITDEKGHTFSNTATTTTTAQVKFGTASGDFDGVSASLSCTHADFLLPQLFTLECWFRTPALGQTHTDLIVLTQNGGTLIAKLGVTSGNKVEAARGGTITGVTSITANSWNHIAFTRDASNVTRIFLNGILEASGSNSAVASIPTYGIIIADQTAFIDDLRITLGACRYVANFIPPTAAFPNS